MSDTPAIPFPDSSYRRERKRIERLAEKWLKPLGLLWWHVKISYQRTPLTGANPNAPSDWVSVARCEVSWAYQDVTLTFVLTETEDMTDERLEYAFVHECSHALVNEMRGTPEGECSPHEERVVTHLARAFVWVFEAGEAKGKRAKPVANKVKKKKS